MNMTEQTAEVVRRGYAAFNAGDMKTLTELFDENASWTTPGRTSIAGDRKGREAAFAQFGRYASETGGTFKADLKHLFTSDDGRVIGVHHNTATRGDKHLAVDCCIVFEVKDGRIAAGKEHFFDLYAWDSFWS
jgi:ketosteroid isomerase-like protein